MSVVLVGEAWYSDPWIISSYFLRKGQCCSIPVSRDPAGCFFAPFAVPTWRMEIPGESPWRVHASDGYHGDVKMTWSYLFWDRFQNGPKFMAHKWDP